MYVHKVERLPSSVETNRSSPARAIVSACHRLTAGRPSYHASTVACACHVQCNSISQVIGEHGCKRKSVVPSSITSSVDTPKSLASPNAVLPYAIEKFRTFALRRSALYLYSEMYRIQSEDHLSEANSRLAFAQMHEKRTKTTDTQAYTTRDARATRQRGEGMHVRVMLILF